MRVLALGAYKVAAMNIFRQEVALLLGLKKRGVDLEVACEADAEYVPIFEAAGITVHPVFPKSKIDRGYTRALRSIIKEGNFDIVHGFYSHCISNANTALRGLSPRMVTYRGAAGLYWHDPTMYLSHLHPRVNGISCVSKHVERNVRANSFLFRPKVRTIYKGVVPKWFEDRNRFDRSTLGIPDDAIIVISIANIRPLKGVEYLIDAMAHIPDELNVHVVLAGQGTDSEAFAKRIIASGKQARIHPLGYRTDALPLLTMSDIFIVTTITSEGLGRSLADAMGFGVPCISTRCGGPEELLAEPGSGILIPVKDSRAIAEAVINLASDDTLRASVGAAGQQRLFTHFNMEQNIQGTLDFYGELLGK